MDREQRRAYMREYYQKHKEKFRRTPEQQARYNAQRREQYRTDPEFRERLKASARRYKKPAFERRMARYGMDPYEFELLANDGCAICGASFEDPDVKIHIDHDHDTGETRGLLCQPCNLALGHFGDDPIVIAAALDYLMKGGKRLDRTA